MINLREEMNKILKEYGWPVLIQKTNKLLRCRCFNTVTQEADHRCPYCLGKAFVSRIERHLTRSESATQVISHPNLQGMTEQGRSWIPANNFYFLHTAQPQVNDMVYEVGWNGIKPTNLIAAYEINNVIPYRGDRGRIEFYGAAVRLVSLDKDFLNISIRRIGNKINYEPYGGD